MTSKIIKSTSLVRLLDTERLPVEWSHRSLYCSEKGAENWIEYCKGYLKDVLNLDEYKDDAIQISHLIAELDFETFLSFGPGDGFKDYLILQNVNRTNIAYVPVDISDVFIENAMLKLNGLVISQVGILADFEEELPFIFDNVNGSKLISVLGNTLGTLDNYESNLIIELSKHMKKDDFLVFEIGTIKETWDFNSDVSSMSLLRLPSFRSMLVQSISLKSGDSYANIEENFNQRVSVKKGKSDVPGAESYEFFDLKTTLKIFCLTRYVWEDFIEWFDNYSDFLEIVGSTQYDYSDVNLGTGIIVLKRK